MQLRNGKNTNAVRAVKSNRIEAIKQECRAKIREKLEEKIRFYADRTARELERIAVDYASDVDPLELIASEYASDDESDSLTRKRRNDCCGVRQTAKRAKHSDESSDECDCDEDYYDEDYYDEDYYDNEGYYDDGYGYEDGEYGQEYEEETEDEGYNPDTDAERMTFVNEMRALIKMFENVRGLAPLDRILEKTERAIEVMAKVREYRNSHVTPADDLKLHRFFETVDRKKAELLETQIPEAREEASKVRVLRSNTEKHTQARDALERLEAEASL